VCTGEGTGDDASSFSDNLVAQYLSHFLAYLEPEPSDDKSYRSSLNILYIVIF
jgi:hypothetical protein